MLDLVSSDFKKVSGIYQIRNLVNDKLYVGSSKNLYKRYLEHVYGLRNNKHDNSKLQRAFNKYGEENFIFEVIEVVENLKKLLEREQYWMDKLDVVNNGYNLMPSANCTLLTEEMKTKISIANSGKNNGMYGKNGRKHHNCVEVVCVEKLKVYGGYHEIERTTGLSGTHICACCNNRYGRKTVGKLHWLTLDDFKQKYPHLVNKLVYV